MSTQLEIAPLWALEKCYSVGNTTEGAPPEAGIHYALALYTPVTSCGLLLGMGESVGHDLLRTSRRQLPSNRKLSGAMRQSQPLGTVLRATRIWTLRLLCWTREFLPHREYWVILDKDRAESYLWWQVFSKVEATPGSGHCLIHLWTYESLNKCLLNEW